MKRCMLDCRQLLTIGCVPAKAVELRACALVWQFVDGIVSWHIKVEGP